MNLYQDGSSQNSFTIADRINALRALQNSFKNVDFPRVTPVSLRGYTPTYELQLGVFLQGRHPVNDWRQTIGINAFRLPSFLTDSPVLSWSLPDFEQPIRDFALDPAQDLLIVIDDTEHVLQLVCSQFGLPYADKFGSKIIKLKIKSLYRGDSHPLANEPELQTTVLCAPPLYFVITIVEEFFGLFCSSEKLSIWNWTTGACHTELRFDAQDSIDDFAFLSQNKFLVIRTRRSPPMIEVYEFPTEIQENELGKAPTPTLLSVYHLPRVNDGVRLYVSCRSDPPPSRQAHLHRPSGYRADERIAPSKPKPFTVLPNERILLFGMTAFIGNGPGVRGQEFALFVRPETFLITPEDSEVSEEYGVPAVLSKKWMRSTRLIPDMYIGSRVWVCYVYGTRIATMEPVPIDDDTAEFPRQRIVILDFNQVMVAWHSNFSDHEVVWDGYGRKGRIQGVREPGIFLPNDFLAEHWISELPYMRFVGARAYHVCEDEQLEVMIDDERIILVKVSILFLYFTCS